MEETIKRIQENRGVHGVVLINNEGIPLKTTMDNSTTVQYGGLVSHLANKAKSIVRDLDPTNELTFLRVKSLKHEVLVAPDDSFVIIVLQHTRLRYQPNQNGSTISR